MKKLVFSLIAIVAVLLLAQCGFSPDETYYDDRPYDTGIDIIYSLKVYLDDNIPAVSQSRAINHELAKAGHDFFEVVFRYDNGPNVHVARTTWELGQSAGVSGVYRDVDYANVTPAANTGSAIIFVGKKLDKTLLALGRLTHVDDLPGTLITSDSKSVTFTITSLKANVSINSSASSFTTAVRTPPYTAVSPANTEITPRPIGPHLFPLYRLVRVAAPGLIRANYNFETSSTAPGYAFSDFNSSIFLSNSGILEKRRPTYVANTGTVFTSGGALDTKTIVQLQNNNTWNPVNILFDNPIRFTFDTSETEDDTVFSLIFSIPVYALSDLKDPETWFLRPGYGQSMRDLDKGDSSNGAIFLGTVGDVQSFDYWLSVNEPPTKGKYSYEASPGMVFDLSGLELELIGPSGRIISWNGADADDVEFSIGGTIVIPGENLSSKFPNTPGSMLGGMVSVRVKYTVPSSFPDSSIIGDDFFGAFHILVGPTSAALEPMYRYVGNDDEMIRAINDFQGLTNGSVMVLVLMHPMLDIPQFTLNGRDRTMIIVAGVPDAIVGRGGGNARIELQYVNTCSFYWGTWPFADELYVSVPVTTYDFLVNATGRASDYFNTPTATTTWFLQGGIPPAPPPFGSGSYEVSIERGSVIVRDGTSDGLGNLFRSNVTVVP